MSIEVCELRKSYAFGGLTLDEQRRTLLPDGSEIKLTPKASEVLRALIHSAPRIVRRESLHDRLWPHTVVTECRLGRVVGEVRAAINRDGNGSVRVRTVRSVGYMVEGQVECLSRWSAERRRSLWWLVSDRQAYPLAQGVNIIGRDRHADLVLWGHKIAVRHAMVTVGRGRATIADMDSGGETFVDGRRIDQARIIRDGDRVRLGDESLVFRITLRPSVGHAVSADIGAGRSETEGRR